MTSDPHLTWDEILPLVAVHHELLNDEEISDFCSLLLLSDRVLIAGDAEHMAPARLLTVCLTELGFSAHTADCMDSSEVTADDALVVFDLTGSESLWRLVEPALKARPILLAVAAGTLTSPVAKQADVAVTLPIWPSSQLARPTCVYYWSSIDVLSHC